MFKNRVRSAVLVFCFLAVTFNLYAYDNGDFQIWNTNDQDVKIGKATKLTLEEEYRYGENATELFYQHYDWGFAWAFDKAFELVLGYRLVLEKYQHKWRETDEPYTILTWKQDIWKLKFEDRNRIEYRHFRFAPDQVRYRNRFLLKYPFDFKTITIAPYSSDEIFVSSNSSGFNQNRFEVGLEFGLTKYVKVSVEYMSQQIKGLNDKWYEANALWLKNRIAF